MEEHRERLPILGSLVILFKLLQLIMSKPDRDNIRFPPAIPVAAQPQIINNFLRQVKELTINMNFQEIPPYFIIIFVENIENWLGLGCFSLKSWFSAIAARL